MNARRPRSFRTTTQPLVQSIWNACRRGRKPGLRELCALRFGWIFLLGIYGSCETSIAATATADHTVASNAASSCAGRSAAGAGATTVATDLAGVPAILSIPARIEKPPIVLWHGFGPPLSERALFDALPLDQIPAIKVYLGLPMFGARAPAGGNAELGRLQRQDFAMLLFKPAVVGAAEELPAVVAALQKRGCMSRDDAISLFGFSAGGAAALIALADRKVIVRSAVVLNASTGLSASVHALERATGTPYSWSADAQALARRTDSVTNAPAIAGGRPPPALLIVQGSDDTTIETQPAIELEEALQPLYHASRSDTSLKLYLVPGVNHGWSGGEPGVDELRRMIGAWFASH